MTTDYKLLRVYNIDWETDDVEVTLPNEVRMFVEADDVEFIADKLSDKYGWLINSYEYEEIDLSSAEFVDALHKPTDDFDYYKIVEVVEPLFGLEPNYGYFQEVICILPNFPIVKEIIGQSATPITEGKYWVVYFQHEITDEVSNKLEEDDLWLLDYITRKQFEENGIV